MLVKMLSSSGKKDLLLSLLIGKSKVATPMMKVVNPSAFSEIGTFESGRKDAS